MTCTVLRPLTLPARRGFTLIELLVVIAILAVLIGLLLPAVQKVRESAARLKCQNNLKQLALATVHYADTEGAYPPARIVERPTVVIPGVPTPDGYPTWLVRILPYLEQQSAYAQWQLTSPFNDHPADVRSTVQSLFLCPSRRGPQDAVSPNTGGPPLFLPCGCNFPGEMVLAGAVTDYAGNHGDLSPGSSGLPTDFYWGGNGTGLIISSRGVNDGRSPGWVDKVRLADVTDGLSNTALIGEMHVPRGKLSTVPDNGPAYDGGRFYHMSRVAGVGVPLAAGPDDYVFGLGVFAFGSWHSAGVGFAFADGHVTTLRPTVDTETLARLCHRSDGLPVGLE
jgi:prepilin-type N-terminal cleavage/methylation domain-containing protein/prepilin-type processing-associated H-X9-DG protein